MRLPNDETFVWPTSERTFHIKQHHPYQCTSSLSKVSNSVVETVKVSRSVNVTYSAFRLETHSLAFNSIICCAFCIKSKSCYVFVESHYKLNIFATIGVRPPFVCYFFPWYCSAHHFFCLLTSLQR